jgi:hypothetical protein
MINFDLSGILMCQRCANVIVIICVYMIGQRVLALCTYSVEMLLNFLVFITNLRAVVVCHSSLVLNLCAVDSRTSGPGDSDSVAAAAAAACAGDEVVVVDDQSTEPSSTSCQLVIRSVCLLFTSLSSLQRMAPTKMHTLAHIF